MKTSAAYDAAVDLLDADHKAGKMFIDHDVLCEDGALAPPKRMLAQHICHALAVHAQIEQEIFSRVRKAIGDDAWMDEAFREHAQAKQAIARIEAMTTIGAGHDAPAKLAIMFDQHVLEEREHILRKERLAALHLRELTLALLGRQRQRQRHLKSRAGAALAKEAA